jgi:hypothetical protein
VIFKASQLGKSFKGLVSYLQHGKDGQQHDRVEWQETRNLPTRAPQVAARMMAATAQQSERVQTPVYHFSVSFPLDDNVNRETMRRVADEVLRDLGLDKHQAVLISHRDTAHQHVHVAVNTVHPVKHRAWRKYRDWPRGRESLRRLEKELGLRQVPNPEQQRERVRNVQQQRAPLLERAREHAAPHFRNAASWGELERGLAAHGMKLHMTGRGMVLTDGQETVKASQIDRAFSRFNVEKRLGSHASYSASRDVASKQVLERSRRDSDQNQDSSRQARPPRETRYRAFSAGFDKLYADPPRARRAFLRAAEAEGPEQASARLQADPRQFGALRGETWPNVQERVTTAAGAGRAFAEARATRTLEKLKATLREHDQAVAREGGLHDAVRAAARARIERQIAWESRARAVAAMGDMRDALPDTFADPRGAARRIWQAARAGERPEQIAQDILNGSERFGVHRAEAKTRAFGFGTRWDKSAAVAAAPQTAQRVETALRAVEQAPSRPEMNRLDERRNSAERALGRAGSHTGLSSHALEKHIGVLMNRLVGSPQQYAARAMGPIAQAPLRIVNTVNQLRQLAAMVTAPHMAVTQAAWRAAGEIVRGIERGG